MAKTRAIDMLYRMTWAITEPALRQMVEIAQRRHDLASWQAVKDERVRQDERVRTVRDQKLPALEGTYTADIIKGIGILPVTGPIFRHGNLFTDMSGASSLDLLSREFHALVNNDAVESILLEIDSPGGEAAGINEFADMVYAARGTKPMYAYADDLCCSAAYWIASATDKIITAETAAIGSIGVIAAMEKPPTADETYVEFVSSQSPYKRPLYQEDGAGRVQQMVDSMADIFVDKVARNRGVDRAHVLENFGAGWVKIGTDAVESGLADEVGTFTSALNDLSKLRGSSKSITPSEQSEAAHPITVEQPAVEQPAIDTIEGFAGRLSDTMRDTVTKLLPVHSATTVANANDAIALTELTLANHTHTGGEPMEDGERSEEVKVDDVSTQPAAPATSATPVVGVQSDANSNDAQRVRALEQQIESLRMERFSSEATNFADLMMAERRAFPAERESLIAVMTQAAMDDLRIGGSTSRVELIKAMVNSRPLHQLTIESLAPALAEVLNRGDRSTGTQDDDRPLDASQVEALIGKTPTGRAALHAIKTGQPMETAGSRR